MCSIRIGYACINTQLPSSNRTMRLKNASPERILTAARENLAALQAILEWNAVHDIRLFRISSEIIPFGSHPVNDLPWPELLQPELSQIGSYIRSEGMRVSMHPGQFTVLNSLREEVVQSSLAELEYHACFLDSLGLDASHKLVLHLGGLGGDAQAAKDRFVANFPRLSEAVARRLVLENDEKRFSLADVLEVCGRVGVPAIFDVFHHTWLPSFPGLTRRELVELAGSTWKPQTDGRQKMHYSDQWPGRQPGSHSQSVDLPPFLAFYAEVKDLPLDIMLEVKDKEQSVLAIQEALRAESANLR